MPRIIALVLTTISILVILHLAFPGATRAREGATPKPIPRPPGFVAAKRQCSDTTPRVECRAALRRALAAVHWQQTARLELARQMLGKLTDWTCIHQGEARWNDAHDPYWGGLQMDRQFMRTYGADMIRRHHGGLANTWTPREQIIVAQRAFAQNRGYRPWPATARHCGLL